MKKLIDKFEMKTNFEGLIKLLATNLYSEPDVFVRELVQNAHDGVVRRKATEPNWEGEINIDLFGSEKKIIVTDNGIGMGEQDIRDFLSVIGSTGTGTARQKHDNEQLSFDLIGQFGIGMLSAFVVSDKVIVKTKKKGNKAFAWHNSGNTDCELYEDDKTNIGTEIHIFIQDIYSYVIKENFIKDAIKKYCEFIVFPIKVNQIGPINKINAPWHKKGFVDEKEKTREYETFLNHRFSDMVLDTIPIEIDKPYIARGALYISNEWMPGFSKAGVVDVFVRRMFIKANDNDILPPWAKFIRGIIESPDLKPTAARDNIIKEEDENSAYKVIQKKIGDLIIDRLAVLAKEDPSKFKRINIWHHYHLKGMALAYPDFMEKVGKLLLFDTNKNMMSLEEYLSKNTRKPDQNDDNKLKTPIYYFTSSFSSLQFYSLAEGKGWTVIDASSKFDDSIIEQYAQNNSETVFCEKLDVSDDPDIFERITDEEEIKYKQLSYEIEGIVRRNLLNNVQVRIRKFEPNILPAVIILTEENEADAKINSYLRDIKLMGGFDEIADETFKSSRIKPIFLSVNASNPLIKKLPDLLSNRSRQDELIENVLLGICFSAIMYSGGALMPQNLDAINKHTSRLLAILLEEYEFNAKLNKTIEKERKEFNDLRLQIPELEKAKETKQKLELTEQKANALQKQLEQNSPKRSEHITIFMMTPFSKDFEIVEKAVKEFFEKPPFCFEVLLARDYIHKDTMLDNLREHINQAHAFIAEITDPNPNVMLELGAALLKPDGRPIFAMRNKNAKALDLPADIRGLLYIEYEDDIKKSLKNYTLKDSGNVSNTNIKQLLEKQEKLFLSDQFLKDYDSFLKGVNKPKLLKKYRTVEDLTNANHKELMDLGIEEFDIPALIGRLKKLLNN